MRNTEEEEQIKRCLPLVKKIAGRYCRRCILDFDDLVQEGLIGVWKAHKNYREGKGVQFSTYVHDAILSHIQRAVDRYSKTHYTDDEYVENTEEADSEEQQRLHAELDEVLKKVLNPKEYFVIMASYGFLDEHWTDKRIAKKLCTTAGYIHRMKQRIIEKLRNSSEVRRSEFASRFGRVLR